ncbi:MAG: dTDP-glucose pyrophosphorylase, partial [Kiritimatiellia bacterium]
PDATLRACFEAIDQTGRGIVLVVDETRKLIGTISDGDLRRAILAGIALSVPVGTFLEQSYPDGQVPITASREASSSEILSLMHEKGIRQVPIVDEAGIVVDLIVIDALLPEALAPMGAVVMAGGSGTRLMPLTEQTPKPMLPVGDRPLLELIVQQLKAAQIDQVNITTHYKSDQIKEHFGDGQKFGIDIHYVEEDTPLGTAGGLNLLAKKPEHPMLVLNGDILTQVDFRSMFNFHREHGADLTIAVRKYDVEVPFGVVDCEGARVTRLEEKPVYDFFVNAGIYLLEPHVFDFVPADKCNMTDLVDILIAAGKSVIGFPIIEYWLDIGQHKEYEQAQTDINEMEQRS